MHFNSYCTDNVGDLVNLFTHWASIQKNASIRQLNYLLFVFVACSLGCLTMDCVKYKLIFIVVLLVLLFSSLTKQVGGLFGPRKTILTPPQVICACPKSGTVLVIDVSLFHYCYYFIWYTAVYVWIWIWLLSFRAIWGSRPSVHCTCWRPGFDLQVLKFIVVHGFGSISPDPLHYQLFTISKKRLKRKCRKNRPNSLALHNVWCHK